MSNSNQSSIYHQGLNREKEAVISDHYIYKYIKSFGTKIYNQQQYLQKALYINSSFLDEHLIPALLKTSKIFIERRVDAAIKRAKTNYSLYQKSTPQDLTASDLITEAMFDRQFLRGPKCYSDRQKVSRTIHKNLEMQQILNLVIVALPFKSDSPLKCRGVLPDLAEVDFLISLYEMTEILSRIYQQVSNIKPGVLAKFTIICDGFRFNQIVNCDAQTIHTYQSHLLDWVQRLGFSDHIELRDYQSLFQDELPFQLRQQKQNIKEESKEMYLRTVANFSHYKTLKDAIDFVVCNEPDPEHSHREGRFFPLFKSLLFSMKFRSLETYCLQNNLSYNQMYFSMIDHLFVPFNSCNNKEKEALRLTMLDEAWQAAIDYISEIKSDRDLAQDPILTCIPGAIRWTIHPKPGQLALLVSSTGGNLVLPWHGTSLFKWVNHHNLRKYTLPIIAIENMNAKPVLIKDNHNNQPFFYLDDSIPGIMAFQNLLQNHLSVKRKS